jgi:hypothetical protein
MAAGHGPAVGAYATALLDHPLPWTKMRQVYALLGLVKKWGADRVDTACASALDHEVVNVSLIGRMLERGTDPAGVARHGDPRSVRPRSQPLRRHSPPDDGRRGPMSGPVVTPELKALLRQVKLGRCSTRSPNALPSPRPAASAMPSSSSSSSPTR